MPLQEVKYKYVACLSFSSVWPTMPRQEVESEVQVCGLFVLQHSAAMCVATMPQQEVESEVGMCGILRQCVACLPTMPLQAVESEV